MGDPSGGRMVIPFSSNRIPVSQLLQSGLSQGIGSGMVAAWGTLDSIEECSVVCAGTESHFDQRLISQHTVFDLASLTKILATTSLYMKWVEQGKIDLDSIYPGKSFTFRQILSHSSGLPAWKPFYESMVDRLSDPVSIRKKDFYSRVFAEALENEPGKKITYSDLGFLLLSHYAEKVMNLDFDQIIQQEVWDGISGCGLHFRPLGSSRLLESGYAATEICPWRGMLQGEVHDDNAWSMGGVAGHAGVFGSVLDVLAWIRSLSAEKLVSFQTLHQFSEQVGDSFGTKRALGFDVPPQDGSGSTVHVFSQNASIGHLGFTGTSLWIDLDQGLFAILLTNRVHPSRDDIRIRALRRAFHETAFNR